MSLGIPIQQNLESEKSTFFSLTKRNFLYTFAFTLLLPVLSLSSSSDISQLFETGCEEHGKTYASREEKSYRLKAFEDNYDFVKKHNKCNSSYTLSLMPSLI
jgi:hypothetical protein